MVVRQDSGTQLLLRLIIITVRSDGRVLVELARQEPKGKLGVFTGVSRLTCVSAISQVYRDGTLFP